MGKANQSIGLGQKNLVASSRYVTADDSVFFFIKLVLGCLILVAVVYWLFGTELGSSIRATGCNSQMARAQGINTNFTKVIALMISNGLVGPVSYTHLWSAYRKYGFLYIRNRQARLPRFLS